jgi:nitrite reductase/ring-hydroxylating ferredoxin subunit
VTVRTRLTDVETVRDAGSWLFTALDARGEETEVLLLPCEESVRAWVNRCMHESQRLDAGRGAAVRDGEVVCPRHGSTYDACSGDCDNGEAAGTTLVPVSVAVEGGTVYLDDGDYRFLRAGGADDGDDGPSSTSHLSL